MIYLIIALGLNFLSPTSQNEGIYIVKRIKVYPGRYTECLNKFTSIVKLENKDSVSSDKFFLHVNKNYFLINTSQFSTDTSYQISFSRYTRVSKNKFKLQSDMMNYSYLSLCQDYNSDHLIVYNKKKQFFTGLIYSAQKKKFLPVIRVYYQRIE